MIDFNRIAEETQAIRKKADAAMSRASRVAGRINGEPGLNADGRRHALQQLAAENKAEMAALREQEKALLEREARALESTLLGRAGTRPEELISFRDAQDRAEQIDNAQDAARLMNRALLSGDPSLARAIYQTSLDNRWATAMQAFEAEHPDTAGVVKDLARIRSSIERSFQRSAAYAPFSASTAAGVAPIRPDHPGEAIWNNYLAESRGETNPETTAAEAWARQIFNNNGVTATEHKVLDLSGYSDDEF